MGSAEIVTGTVSNHLVGTTSISNPVLFMEVNGVPTASSYVVQESGSSKRFIFPKVDSSGNVYIVAMGQVYGTELSAITLSIKVYVAE